MGKLSSLKGKVFERKVANILRAQWPGIEVRRSSQADRAYQSDIYVANGSAKLEAIWFELTDARKPDPIAKLHQAERDITDPNRLPVVIWHRIGERHSNVTTRLWVLDALRPEVPLRFIRNEAVTLELGAFLDVLSGGVKP